MLLNVSLWTQAVFKQKLRYIHSNPVAAGICRFAEEYKYSSASFYLKNTSPWDFLTHYNTWPLFVGEEHQQRCKRTGNGKTVISFNKEYGVSVQETVEQYFGINRGSKS